jgi:hypothetical protein
VAPVSAATWGVCIALALTVLLADEAWKLVRQRHQGG